MTKTLTRYVFCANESPHIRESPVGVWVRHEDARAEIERITEALNTVYKLAGGHATECQCRQCEIFEFLEPIVGNSSPTRALEREKPT